MVVIVPLPLRSAVASTAAPWRSASPGAQIRRIFIDNSTSPVTFWAGNNHHAAILKIEPLD
jgi:hypothetical protein